MHLQSCPDPEREAAFLADQIELQLGGTSHRSLAGFDATGTGQVSFRDVGVLYRTSRQAEALSTVLTARGIPFQLVDLEAYYTKGDCRLLYFWMLALAGLADISHLLFLLGQEQGIGSRSLLRAQGCLRSSLPQKETGLAPFRDLSLDGVAGVALERFCALYERMLVLAAEQPVVTVLMALMERYHLNPQEPAMTRLRELALTFGDSLASFAAHLQTFSDSVVYDQRAEAITLSTLHAAKGLEFQVVCIAGLEEGLLPLLLRQQLDSDALRLHLEEERRLLYVGMTRAIATLYLSWCSTRSSYGGVGEQRQPSRFLAELPAASFSAPPVSRPATGKRKPAYRQLSLFP
jgi:DNA helicase II / ATP-dependent DNA helicase PcrA